MAKPVKEYPLVTLYAVKADYDDKIKVYSGLWFDRGKSYQLHALYGDSATGFGHCRVLPKVGLPGKVSAFGGFIATDRDEAIRTWREHLERERSKHEHEIRTISRLLKRAEERGIPDVSKAPK